MVSASATQSLTSHAPGVRVMGVKQPPSNKWSPCLWPATGLYSVRGAMVSGSFFHTFSMYLMQLLSNGRLQWALGGQESGLLFEMPHLAALCVFEGTLFKGR